MTIRWGKIYISAAACIACVLITVFSWVQIQKNHSEDAVLGKALPTNKDTRKQIIDSPIQPIYGDIEVDQNIARLGEMLFHDKRLSSTDEVSCASCHDLNRGGVDGLPGSVGINNNVGTTNSPTVFNISLNIAQFWDGRVESVYDQIDGPIHHPMEMGSNWPDIVEKLGSDETYTKLFNDFYPDGMTAGNIKDAIANFERTLLTVNSPFDRYLKGDLDAISNNVKQGYEKFKDYGCVACHQGSNVGGNMYQPLGIMGDYFADRGTPITESDLGRFNVTGLEEDKYVFRVPSLRLASITAPYFHDGSAATLKDAVRIMIKYQLGRTATENDEDLIIEFIKSLVGDYKGERLAL